MRAGLVVLAAAAALGAAGAAVAHAVIGRSAPPALPELHGQVSWPVGARPAPAGVPRGRVAMLALIAPGCRSCAAELRFTLRQLPAKSRPLVVRRATAGHSLLLLVDRAGDVRTGYSFPFAPVFVEGDVRTLER
jgi:hypothetical protein